MSIGERIKFHRTSKSLTQKELGNLCIPPMADSAIRRYESGKQIPKTDTLERIAKALDVSISELDYRYLDDHELIKRMDNTQNAIYEVQTRIDQFGTNERGLLEFLQDIESDLSNAIEYKMNSPEYKATSEFLKYFDMLNLAGKKKAVEQIKLLTEIPKFVKYLSTDSHDDV